MRACQAIYIILLLSYLCKVKGVRYSCLYMDSLSNMFLCVYWVGIYVFVVGLLVFGKSREPVSYALNFISRRVP